MSRILSTFLIGLVILLILFGMLGLCSVSEEFVYMINEIPLFRPFVEFIEGAINIETGNPTTKIEPANDFLTVILLALLMGAVKKCVDWFMDAFEATTPFDRILTVVNKAIWNFIFSFTSVFFVSLVLDSFYSYLLKETSGIVAGVTAILIVTAVIVISSLIEIYIYHQRAGIMFIYTFLVPVLKIVFISLIFAFAFVGIKTQLYSLFGILSLGAVGCCFITDAIRSSFIKKIKQISEN